MWLVPPKPETHGYEGPTIQSYPLGGFSGMFNALETSLVITFVSDLSINHFSYIKTDKPKLPTSNFITCRTTVRRPVDTVA